MKDRNGNDVRVGDRVKTVARMGIGGGACYVRAVKEIQGGEKCRVDNGSKDALADDFSWTGWMRSGEIELIA